jgi:hypothetical protein
MRRSPWRPALADGCSLLHGPAKVRGWVDDSEIRAVFETGSVDGCTLRPAVEDAEP